MIPVPHISPGDKEVWRVTYLEATQMFLVSHVNQETNEHVGEQAEYMKQLIRTRE